jgi:hypothetical protein
MATSVLRASFGFTNENVTAITVSQDGTANTAASAAIVVPANKIWTIWTATATQGDATARAIAIEVLDTASAVVAVLAGDLVTTVATGIVVRFVGRVSVPAGYTIRTNNVAISASTPNLKLIGVESNVGWPATAWHLS